MAVHTSARGDKSPRLDELLEDSRLGRLFSTEGRACALQLWILQLKFESVIENRIVYGRLLPYSHSSNKWSATDDDDFGKFEGFRAQLVRLNLYVRSTLCADILQNLCAGLTISEISAKLHLGLSDKLSVRLGAAGLLPDALVYRPVAYLLNRDAWDPLSLASPHGGAGALSASITCTEKATLFCIGERYDCALAEMVVKHLDADTGLKFGKNDTVRFGDLELIVFPTLDDQEQNLLSVSWTDHRSTLVARLVPLQLPQFKRFDVRLSIVNDCQTVYSGLVPAKRHADGAFEARFQLDDQLGAHTDSTELEIFGFRDEEGEIGNLCCRWRMGYIREIHMQGHLVGPGSSPTKFDWLEKTVRPSAAGRARNVLTPSRSDPGFDNIIGGREADPWVPVNRNLISLFDRLHPAKSEGRFFHRWGTGDGEGRLQFAEWIKALLQKYGQQQIVIFDPYFETAGLGLLTHCAMPNVNLIVFRSLPKKADEKEEMDQNATSPDETTSEDTVQNVPPEEPPGEVGTSGVDNLVASCELNRRLLKHFRLRIFGMKHGRLHDRYILILGDDGLPAAGFHLSNSFQSAAQTYPLLVTPIPADTLLEVERYTVGLIREADDAYSEGEAISDTMHLLFDSASSQSESRLYDPLGFWRGPTPAKC